MFRQRHAIIQLLADEDAHTVELVKNQLAAQGRNSVAGLQDLLSVGDARVRDHAREVLGQIDSREAIEELTAFCRDFPDHGGLDALEFAAMLLARALAPGVDVEAAGHRLDEWGEVLSGKLSEATQLDQRVFLLTDFFGRELNFHGNTEDYYNLRNSIMPQVVESQTGIPITLALVYLFVGARAGIEIEGVGFPGHFLIRHDGVLLDPFERGRIMSLEECTAILERQGVALDPEHLKASSVRAIFRRMLANVSYLLRAEDKKLAGIVDGWMDGLALP